jgi:hypothetical protein
MIELRVSADDEIGNTAKPSAPDALATLPSLQPFFNCNGNTAKTSQDVDNETGNTAKPSASASAKELLFPFISEKNSW